MGIKVRIPKKVIELQGYKHKDLFELEIEGKDMILRKVDE
jgi:hypothetical protein